MKHENRLPIAIAVLALFTLPTAYSQSGNFSSRGIPAAVKAVAEEENKSPTAIQSSSSVQLEDGGEMAIAIEPTLVVGQRANLSILATADCHIRIYHFSSDEHTTELYPGNTNQSTTLHAHRKLKVSWQTTSPGGLEHILVYVSKGEVVNTAADKGAAAGDFKVFKTNDLFTSRGIPTAIQAKEVDDSKTTSNATTVVKPAKKFKLLKARLCYHLKDH